MRCIDLYFGSWKLVNSKNFNEYLKEVGLDEKQREIANGEKPVFTVSKKGDIVQITMKTSIKTSEIFFKMGEEFDETTTDGRKCRSVFWLEGEGHEFLNHLSKWGDKRSKTVHELKGDHLNSTYTCNDVVAVCTYEKV